MWSSVLERRLLKGISSRKKALKVSRKKELKVLAAGISISMYVNQCRRKTSY
jgi:hypothetical protein